MDEDKIMETNYRNDIFSKGLRKAALIGQAQAREVAHAFAQGPRPDLPKLEATLFLLETSCWKMADR